MLTILVWYLALAYLIGYVVLFWLNGWLQMPKFVYNRRLILWTMSPMWITGFIIGGIGLVLVIPFIRLTTPDHPAKRKPKDAPNEAAVIHNRKLRANGNACDHYENPNPRCLRCGYVNVGGRVGRDVCRNCRRSLLGPHGIVHSSYNLMKERPPLSPLSGHFPGDAALSLQKPLEQE